MAKLISDFPCEIKEIENCWIPMGDGTNLAARILMPANTDTDPVPAILEYMPYRKRDHNRNRDEMTYRYFAGHGYACIRVDTRGSGDSDGILTDEFTKQEADDGVEIVDWVSSQPWCSGPVGMMGKSWSGFSALIVASRHPDALKAIIPVCAGVDRYDQGLHYTGGCFLTDNLHWTTTMLMFNMRPPTREIVGDKFEKIWQQRLDENEPWIVNWMEHQTDDEYYRQGSVLDNPSDIKCAIYPVGGWADHFAKVVPQIVSEFDVPVRGLVGPWAHYYPHDGLPGPAIGWLQDCLRWWDHWLKGVDNGIADEPRYTAWILEPAEPKSFHHVRGGRWVTETAWPSDNIRPLRLHLNDGSLDAEPRSEITLTHRSPLSIGMATSGDWCCLGAPGESPLDQREDDGKSLVFDTEPLDRRIEILGAPTVNLTLSVDHAVAMIAVRLNDIAPDGTSSRVCYGILNLTHRDGHQNPTPLVPGKRYTISVKLHDIGYAFHSGHRIRVAISTSYWPYVWPSPNLTTLKLYTGKSILRLPERPIYENEIGPDFEEAEMAEPISIETLEESRAERKLTKDMLSGVYTFTLSHYGGYLGPGRYYRITPPDIVLGHEKMHICEINDDDPLSAKYTVSQKYDMKVAERHLRFIATIKMWSSQDSFYQEIEAEARDGDELIWSKNWTLSFQRQLV